VLAVSIKTWALPSRETARVKNWRRVFSKAIQTSPISDRKMRMVNPNPRAPNIFIMVGEKRLLLVSDKHQWAKNPISPPQGNFI